MKLHATTFKRLEQVVTLVARPLDYSGKQVAIAECLNDIETRWGNGLLTLEQRFRLHSILLKGAAPLRCYVRAG